jgi:hypothetical protein
LAGIIINEVISTSNEFTILVSEEEDVAFKVIKFEELRFQSRLITQAVNLKLTALFYS